MLEIARYAVCYPSSDRFGFRFYFKRTVQGGRSVIGIAPHQWFVMASGASAADQMAALPVLLANIAAVAEQGDGRVVLEISGPCARAALAKGIPVDLDPRAFQPGDAAQTMASHLNLHIALLDPSPVFELIGSASFAGSLWSWLSSSAAEFGGEFRRAPRSG